MDGQDQKKGIEHIWKEKSSTYIDVSFYFKGSLKLSMALKEIKKLNKIGNFYHDSIIDVWNQH